MNGKLRKMFLKVPYVTIIFFMLFLCGIVINIVCVIKVTNIYSLFGYDMLKQNYMWLKDVKIILICFYAYTILLMCYNLVISFRATGNVNLKRQKIYCLDSSIVQKILLTINHLTFVAFFILTLIVTIIIFTFLTLKNLCTDGSNVPKTMPLDPYKIGNNPGEIGQYLDLREFTPLIRLRSNETMYLYFENDRLKVFCDDYVSILYVYNWIYFASTILAIYAIFNIVTVYGYNLSRNLTKVKFTELNSLNKYELEALNRD